MLHFKYVDSSLNTETEHYILVVPKSYKSYCLFPLRSSNISLLVDNFHLLNQVRGHVDMFSGLCLAAVIMFVCAS